MENIPPFARKYHRKALERAAKVQRECTREDSCPLSPTRKKYLRAIYEIGLRQKEIRSKSVCDLLGVTRSSFASMVRDLKEDGYVDYSPYGPIILTPKGEAKAMKLYERHSVIHRFLNDVLELDLKTAQIVAEDFSIIATKPVVEKLKLLTDSAA